MLLASIIEPTRALHPRAPPSAQPSSTEGVPVGAGIVLSVPVESGYTTPTHGPTRYIPVTPPSSLKRDREESDEPTQGEPSPPACCTSLNPRFDLVLREGTVLDLRRIAADLGELRFDHPPDQEHLLQLAAMVSRMAAGLAVDPEPDLNGLMPLTRSLRKVVMLLSVSARGEVLRDALCAFAAPAHELSGAGGPPEPPLPHQLQVLLARRRLGSFGILPASPSAATHGKSRRTQAFAEPRESGGTLADPLTELLELLVNATAEEPFAPDETLLAIGRALTGIAQVVVDMGQKVPDLAAVSSSLIPRLARLKEYIMRMPPGLTAQAVQRLQTLSTEAQAEAQDEKTNPVCLSMLHRLTVAVERAGGALGLLGDACGRLAAADPPCKKIARLAEADLAELWTALLWMGDAMAPVIETLDIIYRSLTSFDHCIEHMERNLPPEEVLQLLQTIMEESMQAARMVARLIKPSSDSLLPRLMDSVAYATELAVEARAATDAAAHA